MAVSMKLRIKQKTDTSTNWAKATNFVPLKGELIVYSDLKKIKIGDGTTKVNDLAFAATPSISDISGLQDALDRKFDKTGGTISGAVKIKVDPTASNDYVTALQVGYEQTNGFGLYVKNDGESAGSSYISIYDRGLVGVKRYNNDGSFQYIYLPSANGTTESRSFTTNDQMEEYAAQKSHTHAISDITNLQTTLDSKQSTLTAGDHITISNNKVSTAWPSASDSGYAGINKQGTVTSVAVKMNGSVKGTVTSSGTIDLGTVITDVSGKQDTFTTTQLAAANSGITSSKVSTYDNLNSHAWRDDRVNKGGAIDTHPENGGTIIGYYTNDLAFLAHRGGSARMTNETSNTVVWDLNKTNTSSSPANIFDGSPSYYNFSKLGATTDKIVILIKSPTVYYYGTQFGIGFGLANWRAKDIKIEMGYSPTNKGTAQSPDSDIIWVTRADVTGFSQGLYYGLGGGPNKAQGGLANNSCAWSYMRLTLTNFNTVSPRIAQIFTVNFGSKGLHNTFFGKAGGEILGNTIIRGTMKADSVTATNLIENGTAISSTYAKKNSFSTVTASKVTTSDVAASKVTSSDVTASKATAGTAVSIGNANVGSAVSVVTGVSALGGASLSASYDSASQTLTLGVSTSGATVNTSSITPAAASTSKITPYSFKDVTASKVAITNVTASKVAASDVNASKLA